MRVWVRLGGEVRAEHVLRETQALMARHENKWRAWAFAKAVPAAAGGIGVFVPADGEPYVEAVRDGMHAVGVRLGDVDFDTVTAMAESEARLDWEDHQAYLAGRITAVGNAKAFQRVRDRAKDIGVFVRSQPAEHAGQWRASYSTVRFEKAGRLYIDVLEATTEVDFIYRRATVTMMAAAAYVDVHGWFDNAAKANAFDHQRHVAAWLGSGHYSDWLVGVEIAQPMAMDGARVVGEVRA